MKNLFTLLFILFSFSVFGQDIKKLDEKYGFRDAIFETDFSSFKDMEVTTSKGDLKICKRTSDVLKVGDSDLDMIRYIFYKEKLSTIMIKTKGINNSTGFLAALESQYGKGYQSNRYMRDYNWFGKKATISYDENSATRDATIMIYSKAMMEQEEKDKKEAAAKAGNDL